MTPALRRFLKACYNDIEEVENLRWYDLKLYLIGQDMQIAVWLDNTSSKYLKRCMGIICPWYDNPVSNLEAKLLFQSDYHGSIEIEPIGNKYSIAVDNLNRAIKYTKGAATLERFVIERSRSGDPEVAYHNKSMQFIERFVYEGKFDQAIDQIEYFRRHEYNGPPCHHADIDRRLSCWNLIRACEVDIEEVQRRLIFRAEHNRAYFSRDEHLLSNCLLPLSKQSSPWRDEIRAMDAQREKLLADLSFT